MIGPIEVLSIQISARKVL